ncbi:LOW QUALITY PROTEIN: hypothetical protein BDA96_10G149000 [Sorghum bicolor]|uniref:Uncharacterized protein n=1 Tax=Sorghum bicolor TaxID=4558 RepID=A0A921U111_SORBI|nr:LOW QUALITY PROTEIN: hypothetical protein BDA96_10G149000 [Sorghum bicolor]
MLLLAIASSTRAAAVRPLCASAASSGEAAPAPTPAPAVTTEAAGRRPVKVILPKKKPQKWSTVILRCAESKLLAAPPGRAVGTAGASARRVKGPGRGRRSRSRGSGRWSRPRRRGPARRRARRRPGWHARLLFLVREASLADDSRAAVSVEIYAVAAGTWHFGGDSLVGSVRFLLGDHRLLSRPIGRLRNVPVTARAASLASLRSWNSASTLCVPRTFSSTRHASSRCPRNTRLLGISGGKSAPTKMAMAGLMASSGF